MKIATEKTTGQAFFSGPDLCGLSQWIFGFGQGGMDGQAIDPKIQWTELGLEAVLHLPQIDEVVREHLPADVQEQIKLNQQYASLTAHIYAQYPPEKQAQDDKWSLSYMAKLKAAGVPELEATLVHIIYLIFQGQVADKLVADAVGTWPDDVYKHVSGSNKVEREAYATHMLTKLVKIGIRTEWAEACIRVGKAAIAEGREPEFPPFPKI